jgi:hypothetical protein
MVHERACYSRHIQAAHHGQRSSGIITRSLDVVNRRNCVLCHYPPVRRQAPNLPKKRYRHSPNVTYARQVCPPSYKTC